MGVTNWDDPPSMASEDFGPPNATFPCQEINSQPLFFGLMNGSWWLIPKRLRPFFFWEGWHLKGIALDSYSHMKLDELKTHQEVLEGASFKVRTKKMMMK